MTRHAAVIKGNSIVRTCTATSKKPKHAMSTDSPLRKKKPKHLPFRSRHFDLHTMLKAYSNLHLYSNCKHNFKIYVPLKLASMFITFTICKYRCNYLYVSKLIINVCLFIASELIFQVSTEQILLSKL